MLHDYSSERTFSEAAEMTFNGDYPCEMCRQIAEAKARQDEKNRPKPFPAEERSSLRLVLNFEQDDQDNDLRWLVGPTSPSPGKMTLSCPPTRYLRVPTPPPQV
ncbi:hypothetical protein N8529_00545 [bacterium]|nr:hypothetical protein [bacterium]